MINNADSYDQTNILWIDIIGKIFLFILVSYWTYILLSRSNPWIFMDGVNLLIHESGHLIFSFAGELIMLIAGSATQIFIPILFGIYFLKNKKYFESLFCLFWFGDNLINVSIYIKDAQSMTLDLVGGGTHDWNAILSKLNILSVNQTIGSIFYFLGLISLLISVLLMFVIIGGMILNKLEVNKFNI